MLMLKLNICCFNVAAATCTLSGDPHYLTFDLQWIHYQGTCKYILVNTTSEAPVQFTVYARNEQLYTMPIAILRYVEIVIKNATVRFWRNDLSDVNWFAVAKVAVSFDEPTDKLQVLYFLV